jgi:hypothetical protein
VSFALVYLFSFVWKKPVLTDTPCVMLVAFHIDLPLYSKELWWSGDRILQRYCPSIRRKWKINASYVLAAVVCRGALQHYTEKNGNKKKVTFTRFSGYIPFPLTNSSFRVEQYGGCASFPTPSPATRWFPFRVLRHQLTRGFPVLLSELGRQNELAASNSHLLFQTLEKPKLSYH